MVKIRKRTNDENEPPQKKKTQTSITLTAKQNVLKYLSNGGKLNIITKCTKCLKKKYFLTKEDSNFVMDYQLDDQIVDIACVSPEDDTIDCLIRVVELPAPQGTIDLPDPYFILKATDFTAAEQSDFEKPQWDIWNIREGVNCDPECLSMFEIALKLGYVHKISIGGSPTESRREILAASKGWYEKSTPITKWYNKPSNITDLDKKTIGTLWNDFLERKRCLKCKTSDQEIIYGVPYCRKCIREINGTKFDVAKRVTIPEETKNLLIQKYGWLKSIPGRWKEDTPCKLCGDDYIKNSSKLKKYWEIEGDSVQGFVWWFGEKKCICTRCIERKRIELEKK
jgi:hypothetical protein